MEPGKIDAIQCFLKSNEQSKCDRSCRALNILSDSVSVIPFSLILDTYQKMTLKPPIPLELLEIPINKECNVYEELILMGECAVQRKSIEKVQRENPRSALILCFCPDSVTEPKIVKKLADLIEQLCITRVKLILAHESCCQIGNTLIEKTMAILGSDSAEFSTQTMDPLQ